MLIPIGTGPTSQPGQTLLAVAPQPALRGPERQSVRPGEARQRNPILQVGTEGREPRERRGAGWFRQGR